MSAPVTADEARALMETATPGPWDAGSVQVYATAGCPKHGPSGDPADVRRCACRTVVAELMDRDRALIAAAPDLARTALSLSDDVARLTAERDEAALLARGMDQVIAVTIADLTETLGCEPTLSDTFEALRSLVSRADEATAAVARLTADRDAVRQAHATLAAAGREYLATDGDRPLDEAETHALDRLDALLSDAPAPSTVSAAPRSRAGASSFSQRPM